jgi:signal transduction histidine kinase
MCTQKVADGHLPEIASERDGSGREPLHLDPDRGPMRLVAAVQALSLARNLDTIIEIVRKSARELSNSDGATFILKDGDKCFYVDEDAIGPLWKGQRFPANTCVSGWAMTNRRPAIVKDISADPRIPYEAYRETFVKSLVVVPIRATNPIGAVGIYWAARHVASDFEIEMLQALANSTAVAMENVQLYGELEQRVADRTRQLEDTNRELETFSYSVSHDLQAPLSHIIAYVGVLISDHLESLDDEARRCLLRIQASSSRMSGLIHDLLRLAQFTRIALNSRTVDLSNIARELATSFLEENPGRLVEFEIEDNLEANGDEALLRIVLQNLLGNAWKFTSKRDKALIEVGKSTQADGNVAYFVRDNGAGFNMGNADKLFGPFQRLHGRNDFTGTGIGLATVKRIIHRHGGTVWADATVNEGATFYFTLGESPNVSPLFPHLRENI